MIVKFIEQSLIAEEGTIEISRKSTACNDYMANQNLSVYTWSCPSFPLLPHSPLHLLLSFVSSHDFYDRMLPHGVCRGPFDPVVPVIVVVATGDRVIGSYQFVDLPIEHATMDATNLAGATHARTSRCSICRHCFRCCCRYCRCCSSSTSTRKTAHSIFSDTGTVIPLSRSNLAIVVDPKYINISCYMRTHTSLSVTATKRLSGVKQTTRVQSKRSVCHHPLSARSE